MKRTFLLIAIVLGAAGVCSAQQVNRCVDAAGKVSYSDSACPPGAKRSELVLPPEPPAPPAPPAGTLPYQPPPPRETLANRPPPPEPGGPAVFDHRAGNTADQPPPQADESWRQGYYDYPYGGGGYGRPPPRPRDMRPRLRNCDAAGCNDNQGNHYDNKGRLDRYVTPDGRNCRPVGTTVVCN